MTGVSRAHGRRGAQLVRTLKLIRALDAGWRDEEELAELLAVTGRTIRRDVAFLQAHGFVIQARPAKVSDRGCPEWTCDVWPAWYDLTA